MENLWQDILDKIEPEIFRPVFLTFLKPSILMAHDNSIAIIGAPTDIGAEYLEKRFYSLIKKAFDSNTGENTRLVFKRLEEQVGINN